MKNEKNGNYTFKPRRIVVVRNWDGAIRATPRGPRSCDGPRGSVSMRPLHAAFGAGWSAGQRSLQARRALVSLASAVEWPVNNRCVSAPNNDDDMRRRRGGRVTDGADSPGAAGWSDRARAMAL